ncbi:MAG: hypothetical protein OHK0039_15740 [Bacteroidia bacterium]
MVGDFEHIVSFQSDSINQAKHADEALTFLEIILVGGGIDADGMGTARAGTDTRFVDLCV